MSFFCFEIEIIQNWDKSYGSSKEKQMIWRLIHDLGHGEKKKYVPMILNALISRAEALGIQDDEDVLGHIGRVNAELGDCNISEESISKHLQGIADIIIAKEKELKENAGKQVDADKADADKKAEEAKQEEEKKDQETVNLFIGDMREIWENDKLEKSDKVEYKDGKFQIRIQGDVYEGKTFKELVKAIEDAGLDPKKYLSKQGLDTKA